MKFLIWVDRLAERYLFVPLLNWLNRVTGMSSQLLTRLICYIGIGCLVRYIITLFPAHQSDFGFEAAIVAMVIVSTMIFLEFGIRFGSPTMFLALMRVGGLLSGASWIIDLVTTPSPTTAFGCAGHWLILAGMYFMSNDRPKRPGLVGQTLRALMSGSSGAQPDSASMRPSDPEPAKMNSSGSDD